MKRLAKGTLVFKDKVFNPNKAFFQPLSQEQHPVALMFTCCDSRVEPAIITQSPPGTLFMVKNPGNLVPEYQAGASTSEAAAIEFALTVLDVHHIIVCGHTDCAALKALFNLEGMPGESAIHQWLAPHAKVLDALEERQDLEAALNELIRRNIIQQLQNLRSYPEVASRLAKGQLHLYGWKYRLETGETMLIDPFSCKPEPLSTIIAQLEEEARPEMTLGQMEKQVP
ncbi:carbonic anhydrase [Vampirovibrio chlorellavorus]|uniref:carbonic anhydrase n=1 Tax=Vampirovibrio chlorellavorus TaxID=758823 RepID=UPI0026EEE239|nr:carbonic anhydrase [Vampirovibrio chlorellavorus]